CGQARRPQRTGADRAGRACHRRPLDGRLPEGLHRGDARLGQRPRAPRAIGQAMNLIDYTPVLPELLLLIGACALMIFDLHVKHEGRGASAVFAQVVLALCALATLFVDFGTRQHLYLFNGLFVVDHLANLLKLVCYVSVSAALVYSRSYLAERGMLRGEFMSLLLFSLLGMMVLISAGSFLTVFLG